MNLKVHSILPASEAQGPGRRYSIWVQGCSIRCPGCSNVSTWNPSWGTDYAVQDLVSTILEAKGLDGVTITGGEPLDQYDAVYKLCSSLFGKISLFLTTGYTRDLVKPGILQVLDMICTGPFKTDQICSGQWKGSSNQEVSFLTELGKKQSTMPMVLKEIYIKTDGSAIETGFTA